MLLPTGLEGIALGANLLALLVLRGSVRRAEPTVSRGERPFSVPLSASSGSGFSVLWWNIEHGLTNRELGNNPLGHNLRTILRAKAAPDVIVLGEYRVSALDPETQALARKRYREHFFPYSASSRGMGIAVLVAPGIHVERFASEILDWTPGDARSELERRAYRERWSRDYPDAIYYSRSYVRLRIKRGGDVLNLVPVHLIQPWEKMAEDRGGLGALLATLSLFFGERHPLMYQTRRLRACLERDFGPALDREPLLVIGDFNLTRRTPVYRAISRGLEPAFPRDQVTFPALDAERSGRYPRLQIDHAFLGGEVTAPAARVLPLRGSDHYALLLTVASRKLVTVEQSVPPNVLRLPALRPEPPSSPI